MYNLSMPNVSVTLINTHNVTYYTAFLKKTRTHVDFLRIKALNRAFYSMSAVLKK
jgi:queuine/archaeosine tRNA-ribosyltransferase